MLGTPLLLERPDDPFGPHLAALDTLASSSLPSHHLLIDTLRTCESALVSASLCFTPTTLSSYGSLTTSTKTSLIVIQERLLEWDVMNIDELRMIRDMRAMVEWCMRGSTHQLPPSRAHDYLRQLRTFIHTLSTDYQHACNMKPRSGCPYHSSCRWIDATWHLRHGMIPHRGWDHIEMERHMQPIHNTSILTLQTPEEEEEEWKEMLRVEKEKKEAELAAERERIARFEAEQAAAYQESEDEQTETESEEEDEKAGKKNKRSIRFAIEHPKPTSTPHHQPEEQEEKEESKEQEEPPPAIIPVEPVIPPRRPLSFQFLCITCHTSLIRGHEIERIYGNQVYSKSGVKLTNIHVDVTDVRISRKQRGDDIGNDIDMEEIDRPGSPIHDDDEDEHQHSQLGAGVHDYIHHQHPQDDLSRTVYGKREESMGVHCSTCTSYIGRYYPSQRYYRLIYIHRRSGVNYMYYTGDASVQKLPPLLPEKDETDDETQTDDDETQDDKDIKKEMIITPIYGLPGMYESAQQATIYPYPRFGAAQAYVMMKKHESQMSSNPSSSSIKRPLSSLTRPLTATSNREVIPLSTSRPQTAGTLTHRGKSPTLLAPTLELAQSIVNMLRNTPDPLYSISVDGEDAVAQVQSLILTSMDFNNRRSMDRVTSRILTLMSNFPGSSIYANTSKPVIPLYLDFFIKPTPDLTACRGTARYVFHFLTGKDDSKLRRHKYSLKKMIHTMMRYDDCVFHLSIGGYGGHRLVLVKLGDAYRIFQSNACLENKQDRFTCTEWIYDGSRWSQILSYAEFHHFLALFEAARAHDPHAWNILFCRGKPQQVVPSTRPMDQYRPIKDTFYCVARLQESVKRWD